jgi:hypothetical protein
VFRVSWSPGCVLGLSRRGGDFWEQSKWPWNMIHLMPCRNLCRLYIHIAFTYILRWCLKRSVKWNWTGSAFSTNESAWSVVITGSQSRVWSGPKLANGCVGFVPQRKIFEFLSIIKLSGVKLLWLWLSDLKIRELNCFKNSTYRRISFHKLSVCFTTGSNFGTQITTQFLLLFHFHSMVPSFYAFCEFWSTSWTQSMLSLISLSFLRTP